MTQPEGDYILKERAGHQPSGVATSLGTEAASQRIGGPSRKVVGPNLGDGKDFYHQNLC